jgi:ribosomal protein S18 acetylase RimI-like enzyme
MNIIIRKALNSDIPSMVDLLYQLFSIEEDFSFDAQKQQLGLELLLENEYSACILVAECEKKVVAMLTAQVLISTAQGSKSALLEDMVVDKNHRRMGIGEKLMQEMETWAIKNNISRIQLAADRTNMPALKFYEKLNWQTTKMIYLRKFL